MLIELLLLIYIRTSLKITNQMDTGQQPKSI